MGNCVLVRLQFLHLSPKIEVECFMLKAAERDQSLLFQHVVTFKSSFLQLTSSGYDHFGIPEVVVYKSFNSILFLPFSHFTFAARIYGNKKLPAT